MESEIKTISRGQWQWKSNQDSWSKSEESQWESYLPEHNYLLEKACYDKQKEVDLGDYIVSLEDMKQANKTNATSQRPVRRINWMESVEEVDRSERYFETELPKTINKIFGSLGDFIRFFSKRNSEIMKFTQSFEKFESSNDVNHLNHKILPILVGCLSQNLKVEGSTQDLIKLFKKDFVSFKEFYSQILKAYTMNSSLYRNLNQYLRNESWTEIDSLLPYAFCLCKTFFHFKKSNPNNLDVENNASSITLYRGTAFDETALSFYDIKKFPNFSWNSATSTSKNKRVAQNFMFGSVDVSKKKYPVMFIIEVPLTRDSEYSRWIEASPYSNFPKEDEIILAPGSAFDLEEVLIKKNNITLIHIKMKTETKSLAYQGLMMQGALQSQMLTDPVMKIMCLEGEELHEAFESISGNKLIEKIEFYMCRFDQISRRKMMKVLPTLERLNGLNFISCLYQDEGEEKSKEVENFNISKIEIFEIENFNKIFALDSTHSKYWKSLQELDIRFGTLGSNDMVNHFSWQGLSLLNQLKSLHLDFSNCHSVTDQGIHNLCSNGLKYLLQLTSFTLNLTQCYQITDEGVCNLCEKTLQHLTQLTSLSLDLSGSGRITDKGIDLICSQGLRHLTQLKYLKLDLPRSSGLTDEGMNSLSSQGLNHLTQLTSLHLIFFHLEKITNEGVKSLCSHGLKSLINLNSLSLDFNMCFQITDEGVKSLYDQGLKFLPQLTSLKLKISWCPQITHQGVSQLCLHLTQLEVFYLDFLSETTIPIGTARNLLSQVLKHLSKLKFFSINDQVFIGTLNQGNIHSQSPQQPVPETFAGKRTLETSSSNLKKNSASPFPIYDIEKFRYYSSLSKKSWFVRYLSEKEKISFKKTKKWIACNKPLLKSLKAHYQPHKFAVLNLHCSLFSSIPDEELSIICSRGIKRLTPLTSLSLNFSQCPQTTVNAFNILCSQLLQHLPALSSLNLNFFHYFQFTDQELSNLCIHGLQNLTKLTSLGLNFSGISSPITEEGVKSLCCQGLQYLTQLETLSLNFSNSGAITDKGVNNLCFYGLQNLTQLKSLNLSFKECPNLIDEGLKDLLSQGVENLAQLTTLNIDLSWNYFLLHKMVDSLSCKGFQKLTQLTSLDLNFAYRFQITEEGMNNFCFDGLQKLIQLTSLKINFSRCSKITDKEVSILCSEGLKYLTKLKDLNLSFWNCHEITDQGVNSLCFEGLKYLIQLTSLELDFRECMKIVPFTMQNILRVLRFFGFKIYQPTHA